MILTPSNSHHEMTSLCTSSGHYGSTSSICVARKSCKSKVGLNFKGSFWQDLVEFREGSLPHSIIIATFIGFVCGVAAFFYYKLLWELLETIWQTIPETYIIPNWPEIAHPLYIPLVGYTMAILVGLSVKYLGDPRDLAHVIECVHKEGYIDIDHTIPMLFASQFSILGGGSLGPEAPLNAICASISGVISKGIFHCRHRNIIRKHTMMGMAGALAAFGGSLFALEVTSRLGLEYFEHAVEAIFCGEITLAVFRSLAGLPIGPIWSITVDKLIRARPYEVILGIVIGLIGAAVATIFVLFHKQVMILFSRLNLLEDSQAVKRALLGATAIIVLGLLVPHSMFWGEVEIESIATLGPASFLKSIWPKTGLTAFEMNSFWTCTIMGFAKLIAISWTVAGGYRGGFIFPLFAAGFGFGRALHFVIPIMPVQIATLGMAAAINVTITRTS